MSMVSCPQVPHFSFFTRRRGERDAIGPKRGLPNAGYLPLARRALQLKDPDMTQPILLTADEAAKLLDLSRSKVYQLCDQRRLTHHRLGDGKKAPIRIPRYAIDDFLAGTKVDAHPQGRPVPLKHIHLDNDGSELNRS